MAKIKTLAIDLVEYEDEICDLLQRSKDIIPAPCFALFFKIALPTKSKHDVFHNFSIEKEDAALVELTVQALQMELIDAKSLKVIPLDLTLDVNNDINTEIT